VEATTLRKEQNSILQAPEVQAEFIEPMQCVLVNKLPEGEAWEYELKLDGYRALAVKHGPMFTPKLCKNSFVVMR
jgi:ATP-dependent DNA ligase